MTSAHEADDDLMVLSPVEARRRLHISHRTLQRWIAKGVLKPAYRLPNGHARYRVRDVDALKLTDASEATS
jgi:DNA-binding transcriptional MerR regulator